MSIRCTSRVGLKLLGSRSRADVEYGRVSVSERTHSSARGCVCVRMRDG